MEDAKQDLGDQIAAAVDSLAQVPASDKPVIPYPVQNEPGVRRCQLCNALIDETHLEASPLEPEFCIECMPPGSAAIKEEPLVDVDGVEHIGRHIYPVGPAYKSIMRRIADMTDDELKAHVQHFTALVREAELMLDYRRTALGASKLEVEDRAASAKLKLRGVKVARSGSAKVIGPTPKGSTASAGEDKVATLMELLAKAGITKETAPAVLAAIKAKQAAAEKK